MMECCPPWKKRTPATTAGTELRNQGPLHPPGPETITRPPGPIDGPILTGGAPTRVSSTDTTRPRTQRPSPPRLDRAAVAASGSTAPPGPVSPKSPVRPGMDPAALHELLWTRIRGQPAGDVALADVSVAEFQNADAAAAVESAVRLIVGALGMLFPPGNNVLIEEAAGPLKDAYAETRFYGNESTVNLDFESHRSLQGEPLDDVGKAYLVQTLTHEFVLHNLREFVFYRAAGRQPEELNAHRDVCLPGFREIYSELSLRVVRSMPRGQQRTFIDEWRREIKSLAQDRKNGLSSGELEDAKRWADQEHAAMLASCDLSPSSSEEGVAG